MARPLSFAIISERWRAPASHLSCHTDQRATGDGPQHRRDLAAAGSTGGVAHAADRWKCSGRCHRHCHCATVVEPTSNGIGSDAFAIIWDGKALHGLNASGRSPAAWTIDYFQSAIHKCRSADGTRSRCQERCPHGRSFPADSESFRSNGCSNPPSITRGPAFRSHQSRPGRGGAVDIFSGAEFDSFRKTFAPRLVQVKSSGPKLTRRRWNKSQRRTGNHSTGSSCRTDLRARRCDRWVDFRR